MLYILLASFSVYYYVVTGSHETLMNLYEQKRREKKTSIEAAADVVYTLSLISGTYLKKNLNDLLANSRYDKTRMDIFYRLPNGETYTLRIPRPKKGPRETLIKIYDGDNDVTPNLREFMGPGNNFHAIPFKPSIFGIFIEYII